MCGRKTFRALPLPHTLAHNFSSVKYEFLLNRAQNEERTASADFNCLIFIDYFTIQNQYEGN